MKQMKQPAYLFLMVGLIVIGIIGTAGLVMARGGHGGPGGGMHLKMLWDLDLSTEQKAAIGNLLPAYREEKEALREKRQAARDTMHTLMTADALDENGIREASRAMAPIMEEMAVLRARFVFDLKDILSPEQVQQLQKRREGNMGRRGKHRQFRQEMMDTWLQMPADGSAGAAETGQ
jgi:Spy/CpxP family protein refolding chaperone